MKVLSSRTYIVVRVKHVVNFVFGYSSKYEQVAIVLTFDDIGKIFATFIGALSEYGIEYIPVF